MADFDTSGVVLVLRDVAWPETDHYTWEDLSPFEQGYVEALLRDVDLVGQWLDTADPFRVPGYSDLAPDALAMILRDCGAALDTAYWGNAVGDGEVFWFERQREAFSSFHDARREELLASFPAQLVFLNDAGKVCLQQKEG